MFYARTSEDNIYGWGRNNVGQLGDTTTTDRYRPIKMQGFNASDNGGIAVWQKVILTHLTQTFLHTRWKRIHMGNRLQWIWKLL